MATQASNPSAPHAGGTVANTNVMAILALIFAFVFSPLGIVFGALAKRQIAQTGEQGAGLAKAGFWLGIAFTALGVVWFAVVIIAAASASTT